MLKKLLLTAFGIGSLSMLTNAQQFTPIQVTPAMEQAKLAAPSPVGASMVSSTNCDTLASLCNLSNSTYVIDANANAGNAIVGNNYDCLATQPNPAWYYMEIGTSGDILLELAAASDIDFIVWGPYADIATAEATCGNYQLVADCSYSGSNIEDIDLLNTNQGEVYVLLITNFSNIAQPATLTQTGGNGLIFCADMATLSGTVYSDDNGDCMTNGNDIGTLNVIVQAGNYYTSTDSNGYYELPVDTGLQTVSQIVPAYQTLLMVGACPSQHLVQIDSMGQDTTGIDFHNEIIPCPLVTVDVGSDRRRLCFTSNTYVEYCNDGFADTNNVEVTVALPDYVHFLSADHPYTVDSNGHYVFFIDTLLAGDCGTIHIVDSTECDPNLMGLIQCTRAWITPFNDCYYSLDTTWTGVWDNSNLLVEGECQDSLIDFTVYNVGMDMIDSTEYRIYSNGFLIYQGMLILTAGDSLNFSIPADGSTIRVEVDQHPSHPISPIAYTMVLDCNGTGSFLATAFALPCGDDFFNFEEDCLPIINSYDPNDKRVFPAGVGAQHYVQHGTNLEYTIRFQNTGSDTAYTVVVVDTLPNELDLSTLVLGTSSHSYNFSVSGSTNPILTFTFDDIDLVDSMTNPAGSQGFFKYKISPNQSLPNETVVSNRAGIYFDFNPPIITNYAWVTLTDAELTGTPIAPIISSIENTQEQATNFKIYPNPAQDFAIIDLSQAYHDCTIQVMNTNGQVLQQTTYQGQRYISLELNDLVQGVYYVQILTENGQQVLPLVKQ